MHGKLVRPGFYSLLILLLLAAIAPVSQAQIIKRPDIIGIAAVEVQVSDVQKALAFYKQLLNYAIKPLAPSATAFEVKVSHRQTIQVKGGLPEGQAERLLSLSFQTTDAEAMRQYLKQKGIAVPDSLHKKAKGTLSFSISDPDHHTITFVQFLPPPSLQPFIKPVSPDAISHRILHAGLTISNDKVADAFYKDILGFSEIWRGGANDSVTNWINMRLPESTDYLEYMLINAPPNKQQLGSLHHIALLVPDMQMAVDHLRVRSEQLKYPVAPPRIGRNNRWQLNLYDPDGTRVELMEPFTFR